MAYIKNKTPLTLLVHKDMVVFDWGKAVIDCFYRQSLQKGFALKIVFDWHEITEQKDIILFGVNKEWLKETLENLNKTEHILLIDGVINYPIKPVSHLLTEQGTVISKSVEHLYQCGCKKIAFFGVQKYDTSDQSKADAFAAMESAEHTYYIEKDVDECFEKFLLRAEEYDGVICSNDIIAVYFLSQCKSHGIEIGKKLKLIGNGNLWIGAHTEPSVTSIACDIEEMVSSALQTYKNLCRFKNIESVDVYMKSTLISRESTSEFDESKGLREKKSQRMYCLNGLYENNNASDELCRIQQINSVLSSLSAQKQKILYLRIKEFCYSDIANEVHLSEDTVKYHLKKIYKQLEVHSKKELLELLCKYCISVDKLKR